MSRKRIKSDGMNAMATATYSTAATTATVGTAAPRTPRMLRMSRSQRCRAASMHSGSAAEDIWTVMLSICE